MNKPDKQASRTYAILSTTENGGGTGSAGQSGDTQGLSPDVAELVEEGQFFEAEAISGVEDAPDADVAEVHTKQVPEDDVPPEYRNPD